MAAFRDDMPLIAGVDADWDDMNTYEQVKHPDADISPIRMKTMHHLPQIFFDTLHPERPDCPVLIPNTFSVARDRLHRTYIVTHRVVFRPVISCQLNRHRTG